MLSTKFYSSIHKDAHYHCHQAGGFSMSHLSNFELEEAKDRKLSHKTICSKPFILIVKLHHKCEIHVINRNVEMKLIIKMGCKK